MKVNHIEIKNFRSISETSFQLSPTVTAIAGGNESGKSNALKALERFLSRDPLDDDDQYQLSNEQPEITIEFQSLSDEEQQNISWALRKKTITKLTIKRSGNIYTIIDPDIAQVLKKEADEAAKKLLEDSKLAAEVKNDTNSDNQSETDGEVAASEDDEDEEVSSVPPDNTKESDLLPPKSLEEITSYILEYIPKCELISDISSLISGENLLVEKIFSNKHTTIEEKNKYETVEALLKIGGITKDNLLEPNLNKRIQVLRKKSSIIAKKLRSAWSQEDVKLNIYADHKNLVIHFRDGKNILKDNKEDDTKWIWTLPENRSFGFRWYVTFYAKYLSRILNQKDDDIVFLIDDAGVGLNKTAQIDLLGEFNKITSSSGEESKVSKQVVYVSHSKYMFDWDMRKSILVAEKKEGGGTIIEGFWWEKFSRNSLAAPLDEIGLNWLEDLLEEKNLIVEGHSDGYLINQLLTIFSDKLNINDVLNGFKIIPGNGIPGQFDIAKLCDFDKKKFLMIFDSDAAGDSGKSGADNSHFNAKQIEELTASPVNGKAFKTIEDFVPVDKLTASLEKYGQNRFTNRWQTIVRLHKPDVQDLGVIGAIEKRLTANNFTADEIKDFLKGKYYFVLDAINGMDISSIDEEQKTAIGSFFINLNTELKRILTS